MVGKGLSPCPDNGLGITKDILSNPMAQATVTKEGGIR